MDETKHVGASGLYYSLLRWRPNPVRDEGRNVAVVVVGDGTAGGLKAAPISSISSRLREQGLLDSVLQGFAEQFAGQHVLSLGQFQELRGTFTESLYFTPPQPAAGHDVDSMLGALYRALVAPAPGGSSVLTKGRLLDRVVTGLRSGGFEIDRGRYVGDFLFDVVVPGRTGPVLNVLSFATTAQKWAPVEQDAGHFLYALERTERRGLAVVAPPTRQSHRVASDSFARITRWFKDAKVTVAEPADALGALQSLA